MSVFEFHFVKKMLLRNYAVDFVEICKVCARKAIIEAAKRIINSYKVCRSYSDLNFGVTFLEHSVLTYLQIANILSLYLIKFEVHETILKQYDIVQSQCDLLFYLFYFINLMTQKFYSQQLQYLKRLIITDLLPQQFKHALLLKQMVLKISLSITRLIVNLCMHLCEEY